MRISEYQPTFIHTKLMAADGSWSVIGSATMDNRSRKLNDEVVLGISSAAFAARLAKVIAGEKAHAKPIMPAQLRQRSVFARAREWLALASVQQY